MANILIVDDEADFRLCLGICLKEHQIFEAEDGFDMFHVLMENNIDLILLDLHLKNEDGIHLCEELKISEWRDVPVAIMTGDTQPAIGLRSIVAGADLFLPKPIGIPELKDNIAKFLDQPPQEFADRVILDVILQQKFPKAYHVRKTPLFHKKLHLLP